MNTHPSHSFHHHYFQQQTLSRDVSISGVGIHTGKRIGLRLRPAPADTGIVFRRTDCGGIEIPALASEVSSLELATTLGRDDVTISTIEHLMAALQICSIDNLIAELDGPEVPILDGSAMPFLQLIQAAGVKRQEAQRRILAVTAPLTVQVGGKTVSVAPYPGFRVTYSIDFANPHIGHQEIDLEIDAESFRRELAEARTFAQASDVEWLHRRGLGQGGNADNCIVYGDDGPVNTELRFADEPVRHKALDAVGDLALLGAPIWGHVRVERGGHQMHFALVEALRERPDCWAWAQNTPRRPADAVVEGPQPPALATLDEAGLGD